MTALDILVHLRRYDGDPPALRAALALARRVDTVLHGLYVAPIPPAAFTSPETVAVLVHESDRRYTEARQAGNWWNAALAAQQIPGDWQVALSDPLDAICHAARWSNLLLIERPMLNPDAPVGWGLVSRSVFHAGVPLLVVPDTAPIASVGERAVIAWNGSREAIRAIHGALPVLRRAERVVVLDGSTPEPEGAMLQLPRFALARHLEHHGIQAEFTKFTPGSDKGAQILEAAHAAQADLIVMGAWGHSRLAELALGGTTRALFQTSDIPLLVAH